MVLKITAFIYLGAFICFLAGIFLRKKAAVFFAQGMGGIGLLFNAYVLFLRWQQTGNLPFTNIYEALIIFALMTIALYGIAWRKNDTGISGACVALIAFVSIWYASFFDTSVKHLMPALRCKWIFVHVSSYMIGYAALALSFVASGIYLCVPSKNIRSEFALTLDSAAYKLIMLAMPFITVGLTTGSVWAYIAWGRYWGWDPKETCSLISWFMYVIYIHGRVLRGWKGKINAAVAVAGFFAVIFTFIGVTFFLRGLHSYR